MNFRTAINRGIPIKLLVLIGAAICAVAVFSSVDSIAEGKSKRVAIIGTAMSAPHDGLLLVATRSGVIHLTITSDTAIDSKKGYITLSQVQSGSEVVGYFYDESDQNIAAKLTFKKRNSKSRQKHLIGVVVEKKGKKLTIQTTDGDEVEVEVTESPTDDPTTEGSLIVTVVEEDEGTGALDAIGVRTAEETITRLNEAINHEITLVQEKLLKVRMPETASVHLKRLYATLDDIQDETEAKIQAAYEQFEANYTTTLNNNLIAPPLVIISGKVLTKQSDLIVVAKNGNGRRSFVTVPTDVEVELLDGSSGSYTGVTSGDYVEVSALPQTAISSPIAQLIKIIPSPLAPDDSGNGNGQTITGTIVLVDDGDGDTDSVIVIDDQDGSDGAAVITPDTIITGEDELEPGQEVEVTLGDDGFTADEVEVLSPPDEGSSDRVGTPAAPLQYTLIGKVREVSLPGVILDGVFLAIIESSPTTDPLTVGEEIRFTVEVDADGRFVIVGIEQ
ncbi:MAG: hypothetical protein O2974_02485 [Chloroflexi bacterium]|nr:hypothetical protein [Chloroflexota bacterium]